MTDRDLLQQALDALEAALSNDQPYISRSKETAEALRARLAEDTDVQYEVWQDGEWQAGSNSLAETMHYAVVYAQDGPAVVHEVTRREICKIEN